MSAFKGWKSYAIAVAALIYAGYGVYSGSLTPDQAIGVALGALGLGALRHGITTEAQK